uniref:DNA helicase n=1 Tax=Strongyloides papillosus TaxID=174720 RepID=A0A0N5BYD2_STREA
MLVGKPYFFTMSSFNNGGYVDDGEICWKDSPKAFPVQVERALIKNNICAKLIRDMDQGKASPKKPEDSPLAFRSRTLLPRKKFNGGKLNDSPESPRSRARRKLRSISKSYGKTTELPRENVGNNKNEEKDEVCGTISSADFQTQFSGKINETISQSTFMTDLLRSGRVTSTPKVSSGDIGKKASEIRLYTQDNEEIYAPNETLKEPCQRENLVHSFEERMTISSQESFKENYDTKKSQESKKSVVQNICTPFQKITCIRRQTDNTFEQDTNKITNNGNKGYYKPETIKVSHVPVTSKLANDQNKNISPQQVNSAAKNFDDIDDDFYNDDVSGFFGDSGKSVKNPSDLSQKNGCSVSAITGNKLDNSDKTVNPLPPIGGKSDALIVNNEAVKDGDLSINKFNPSTEINGIQSKCSNVNMCNKKLTILAEGTKEDPIKDDFYDDFDDEFFDSINEIPMKEEEESECIENTRKRKSGSSSINDQSSDIKIPHLEINGDPIEDDFYDDDDDVNFIL